MKNLFADLNAFKNKLFSASVLLFLPIVYLLFSSPNGKNGIAQKQKEQENILLIIADDMSKHAGVYGEKAIRTPGIDAVAASGVVFNNAFCTASSCSPSRASILTGKYPHQLEEGGNLWGTLPAKFPNYTRTLARAGYTVGLTGKGWGPGQALPGGYQENPAGPAFKNFAEFIAKLPAGKPFCFWLGPSDPHRPYEAELKNKTEINKAEIKVPGWLPDNAAVREDLMDYLAEVKRFDQTIEEAVKLLKQKGLYNNTLIIVTSDNGMPFPRAKANVYDSGSNIPLVMSWGNHFGKGKYYNEFVTLADIAPTILEVAGLKTTDPMTGKSLLPLLQKNQQDKRYGQVFLERERHASVRDNNLSYPVRAIRTKDYLYIENLRPDRWPAGNPNLTVPPSPFGDIDNGGSKKFLIENRNNAAAAKWVAASLEKRPARELYILQNDKDQLHNVAEAPANVKIIQSLKGELDQWRRDTQDPLLGTKQDIFDTYPYYGGKKKN
ncbi:heparan N-sulfatase [Adhaeribacter aerolatus]|uniref:Heparan N-sulfatase n=1 Tax=Adhaeribacter aerolatus TaxID=670289 RepID=A0A512B3Y2_9BACT|nr:sulfatase [Adhaeribacter aerolatus]GEO06497.1 heparan N-sulfatase [Adhaeribacter aerolatus]